MLDVCFYMKTMTLKENLGADGKIARQIARRILESARSRNPVVYGIETTNDCRMKCEICPRTKKINRPVQDLDMKAFKKIAEQIRPFSKKLWRQWETFVKETYQILPDEMNENHFFLYIIPKVLVLHGYGDPLLDDSIGEKIKILTKRHIKSYFSCHPLAFNMEKIVECFENELTYLKFSASSLNHPGFLAQVDDLLAIKKQKGYATKLVMAMVDINHSGQKNELAMLKRKYIPQGVYVYLKSQDQRWYRNHPAESRAIHWNEFCQFPWSSMSIHSDGSVVPCCTIYNHEMILGNTAREKLKAIWNGTSYKKFREQHIIMNAKSKCTTRCDMKLIGEWIGA
ncbi:MAG: hypothetical protein A3G33_10325 [Omnitrophica bacterium RIFCSPLOWO2_12_FULL_44_17]|uniref:4Fe4S-binding SPASM domain-containing protein n=1 Tax=Candidatus Danuiimicrobium aquiferis TaxID=1801832 RepID=A0A1G1L119_9BACT|nr:MAG: hypothetical protein A3B72_01600 [Omnitrophica bacterium RIFCSPHIGHO2_02_FULL_45_28]OGW90450.1 MAG: hypothetical protein A3E74_03535 [Omnitrophica bacterium RIFCSPHIGHO2_12_FULL_44_12]OGW98835.1 MAG: hypothetical protein A3G33_10325 [Omnitrophica bacterium RIFCSPLOWO2_12_FULL_44_17]OGX02796.1 MAG: hypothetical protein A3J12_02445 [Omnitrophica bacterium RIFCSPLOWO2_02_FULL_44_11]